MVETEFQRALQEPWFYLSAITLIGLTVGSFLNVVIYRLPKILQKDWKAECSSLLEIEQVDENKAEFNLAFPNSHCPKCNTPIKAYHNIPILSYLALGGKCHACKVRISVRYPVIELASGLLCFALALNFGATIETIGLLFFTWSLIALTMIDVDTMLLPDDITLPLMWAGLILNSFGVITDFHSAFWGAIAGYGILWSVFWLFKAVTGKDGMGYGDFKLLAAIGAWLGWQALPLVILLSSLVGAVIGISLILFQNRDNQTPIPFGPYLAIAGWIAMMWGENITGYYLKISGITT